MSKTLFKELERRAQNKKIIEAAKPEFATASFCFEKQLAFITEQNRFKVACCSRRSGKTVGIAADLVETCKNEKDVIVLYVTLTKQNARAIIWGDIKKILEDYGLTEKTKTDDTRLTVYFHETRSEIRLGGAKDEAEIEKYRGWKLKKAYVDEAQSFRKYLKYFVEKILLACLRDHRGSLGLTGTPGPIPAGYFYEMCHNSKMAQHRWTAFDNPHMHNLAAGRDLNITLQEEWDLKGVTEMDPGVRREDFGEWVEDTDALVYKFNKKTNVAANIPNDLVYVFGIDIGWSDADAIAVLGYDFKSQNVYLIEELITEKQTISDLVAQIQKLSMKYQPVKMVMDAGALGKKIQEEIRQRHQLAVEAAEKHRKFEFIELLNDDLRTGKFKAYSGSRFEEDAFLTIWDRSEPGVLKIDERYHTDIGDAVLYAWRECKHFLPKTEIKPLARDSDAFMDELEAREAEALERKMKGDDIEGWGITDDDLEAVIGDTEYDEI